MADASVIVRKKVNLQDFPEELLLTIFSDLDYKSLCRVGRTCKHLNEVSLDESLWKKQCEREFLIAECSEEERWRKQFLRYHARFGRIHSPAVYRTVRRLWDRLEKHLQENDEEMFDSLREPCDYSEIQIAEQKMTCCFPPDLRCSLQIHNGQQMARGIGLHGSIMISTYFRSEGLLDAASMARLYDADGDLQGCVPLTYCYISRKSQYIAVNDLGGFTVGEVYYPTPDQTSADADIFITGKTFLEWFTELVDSLENKRFPRIEDRLYRFYEHPDCIATSLDCFQVRASTCFMPDLSTITPPHFFYTYRITISMDANASRRLSCQLYSRHWIITNEEGKEEIVDGPGVVGQFPVLTPGEKFSWVSCTTFSTTHGNMRGYFTMRNLETMEEIDITCPTFHMTCLPYKTATERQQQLLQRKKNL